MGKTYNIRWRDEDAKELARLVKNYNEKLRYIEKNKPELAPFQPNKQYVSELKEKITTRNDFKKILNKLGRFSVRGSEELITTKKGVTLTNYQRKEINIERRAVNLKRKYKQEKLGGDGKGMMGEKKRMGLKPKKKLSEVSPKGYEKYKQSLEKEFLKSFEQQRMELYLENYFISVRSELGSEGGRIIRKLKSEPIEKVVKILEGDNTFISIEFNYTEDFEKKELVDRILEEWDNEL